MSKKKEEGTPQVESGSKPQANTATQIQTAAAPELESLMQVRELLVGPVASDVEQRVARMSEHLDESIQTVTNNSTKRIDEVENSFKAELSKLSDEVGDQRGQFHDRLERLERELSLGLEQMRGNIQEATDSLATTTESMRTEMCKEVDAVRGTIQDLFDKVMARLDLERQQLHGELVDRESLSAALSEVAIRLAPVAADAHDVDPSQPDIEIDHILGGPAADQV